MKARPVSLVSATILRALKHGHCYGFDIMQATGLPSGTIYPALRRLEILKLIRSDYDSAATADSGGPPRKCFRVTAEGKRALEAATERFPVLSSPGE
jgi:PadR family transcriptional regulator, regulatory protein PadR